MSYRWKLLDVDQSASTGADVDIVTDMAATTDPDTDATEVAATDICAEANVATEGNTSYVSVIISSVNSNDIARSEAASGVSWRSEVLVDLLDVWVRDRRGECRGNGVTDPEIECFLSTSSASRTVSNWLEIPALFRTVSLRNCGQSLFEWTVLCYLIIFEGKVFIVCLYSY